LSSQDSILSHAAAPAHESFLRIFMVDQEYGIDDQFVNDVPDD
jgi:hypothetical protein